MKKVRVEIELFIDNCVPYADIKSIINQCYTEFEQKIKTFDPKFRNSIYLCEGAIVSYKEV